MNTKIKQIALIAGAFLIWVALVALQVGGTFGFVMSGLVGLLSIVSILVAFVIVVISIITRRWRDALYSGIPFLFVCSTLWVAGFITDRQCEASKVAAQPIIAAAMRFHADTGKYPQSLDDLVPTYLPTKPHSVMGFYGTPFSLSSHADCLYIRFALPHWMRCSYDSDSKQWHIRD